MLYICLMYLLIGLLAGIAVVLLIFSVNRLQKGKRQMKHPQVRKLSSKIGDLEPSDY